MILEQIQALSDDEIRARVAELTGDWKNCRIIRGQHGDWDDVVGFGTYDDGTLVDSEDPVPNYPADLNACAEFEATLTFEQAEDYHESLSDITFQKRKEQDNPAPPRFATATAPARQRCEAFLAVMGKEER